MAGSAGWSEQAARTAVEAMLSQMTARGPDDEGITTFPLGDACVALGNRRLAIIDPSPAGHQPMRDPERGSTIVFNGMIYNFRQLRRDLETRGEQFSSECDTEVLLKAYGAYGTECARHLQGMFAFAIWDGQRRQLVLGRDRLGIKPLYYIHEGGRLLFSSTVRALLATDQVAGQLSPAGVASFLSYGAVSEPFTAIDGVMAFPPGHLGVFSDGQLKIEQFWEPPSIDRQGTHSDPAAELTERLSAAIRSHLIADAPLGVFLSGGLDSSVVASIAAGQIEDVRTISVVFDEEGFSEQEFSGLAARHIGSRHTIVRMTASDFRASLNAAFQGMDQPTFDGINTYAVARGAVDAGLKVAVSGLGADELFDGYGFVRRIRALERARRMPAPLRRLSANAAVATLGSDRAAKARHWLLDEGRPGESYDLLRRLFLDTEIARLCNREPSLSSPSVRSDGDLPAQVTRLEIAHYMRNVLLRDTDAMSMCQSLEVRVPYLDDAFLDWALRLPAGTRGERKRLLRKASRVVVPAAVAERPKRGFALPVKEWMQGPIEAEVEACLLSLPPKLAALLEQTAVTEVWRDFAQSGQRWLRPWALYALARWTESALPEARSR